MPDGTTAELYQIHYLTGTRRKLTRRQIIADHVKHYVYCPKEGRLLYATAAKELHEYTDHDRLLLNRCKEFAVSPDGRTILYTSGNKMRRYLPDGTIRTIAAAGCSAIPLSVSNDGSLLIWAKQKQSGYNTYC